MSQRSLATRRTNKRIPRLKNLRVQGAPITCEALKNPPPKINYFPVAALTRPKVLNR